jgi:HEAT repeat protein
MYYNHVSNEFALEGIFRTNAGQIMTPETAWLSSYTSKIAADLTMRLVGAVGRRVARPFQEEPRRRALQEALEEGLSSAIERFPLASEHRDHYLDIFQGFMKRDAVIEELTQVIDPRPDSSLDMDLLRREFVDAGFDPGHIEFPEVISRFVAAFYDAAAKKAELQGAIEIALLRKITENTGAQQAMLERQTKAVERSADQGGRIVDLTEQMLLGQLKMNELLEAVQHDDAAQPGRGFDIYQQLAAGLGRQGVYITFDAGDHPVITTTGIDITPTIDISPLKDLLDDLRRVIVRPVEQLSPEELAAREERYRGLIKTSYCNLRLEGLSTGVRPISLPLEDVYVHLRAVSEVPEGADVFTPEERSVLRLMEEGGREDDVREAQLRLDAMRRERWTRERIERFPIAEALRNPAQRGLVILGDPGSGKTTLLQFLALIFARGPEDVAKHLQLGDSDLGRLPIFVPLAAYDEMLCETTGLTIGEFMGRYYDRRRAAPGLDPIFQAALDAGTALVLLDGLDEVVEESRRKYVAEQASAFIREAMLNGNRVLLTSRIYGYRAAPLSIELPHVTVLDFRREEIEIFARQWSHAMAVWDAGGQITPQTELLAQEEERLLLSELASNPGVERLAVNPLLLTMLALLRRQVGGLPQRRIQLYDLYVRALIQNWEDNRSRGARLTAPKHTDTLEAETVLIPLSLWLQQNRPSGTTTREELMAQLVAIYLVDAGEEPDSPSLSPATRHVAQRRAEIFLADMRQFSGLLVERGQNAFGFRHLTFQEYFAARALARMQPAERWGLVHPNLHANRWREPILLAAARLGVTENRSEEVTGLLQQILDAGSEYEAILHRDLLLACDCAVDDVGVDLRVLRRLVKELAPLGTSSVPSLASGSIDLLSRLGLLRAGEVLRLPEALNALAAVVDSASPWNPGIFRPLSRVWTEPGQLHESTKKFLLQAMAGLYYFHQTFVEVSSFIRQSAELREAFVSRLEDSNPEMRAGAVQSLVGLVGQDMAVRAAVISRLDDRNAAVRGAAIGALEGLVAQDPAVRAAVSARLSDAELYVRFTAMNALRGLLGQDPALCSVVTAKLDDGEPLVRARAIEVLAGMVGHDPAVRLHVEARLNDADRNVRVAAIDALTGLIDQDAGVRGAVVSGLDDPASVVRQAATRALGGMVSRDGELRSAVMAKLQDHSQNVRLQAIDGLGKLAGKDSTVTAAMCALLSHPDWGTRLRALSVLTPSVRRQTEARELIVNEMGNEACLESRQACDGALGALGRLAEDPAIAALIIARLKHPVSHLRSAAVRALARLVDRDASVRSAVGTKLDDMNSEVRSAAVGALAGIVGQDAAVYARVVSKLEDPDDGVRVAAVEGLAGLSGQDKGVRRAIIARLEDEHANVRLAAVEAVKSRVQQDLTVRAAIIVRLGDEDWRTRKAAVEALAGLIDQDTEARAAIISRLGDSDSDVGAIVAAAVAGLVIQDAEFRADIVAKTSDSEVNVRAAAVMAVAALAIQDPVVCAVLIAKLEDQELTVRLAAIRAMERLLGHDEKPRAAIIAKLDDSLPEVRAAAVVALRSLVGKERRVRVAVLAKIDDGNAYVRATTIEALRGFVQQDTGVRAAVIGKLDDGEAYVRATAVQTLATLAIDDRAVWAALVSKLEDQDLGVRVAAVLAICLKPIEDAELYLRLLPALGFDDEGHQRRGFSRHELGGPREAVVRQFSRLVETNPTVREKLAQLLRAKDWRVRLSAIEVFAGAHIDTLRQVVPELITALDDRRGLDSWPARIEAAEVMLNDYQHSETAIQTILPALDYATHPLVFVEGAGNVRRQAAVALGNLKAERRDPRVLARLERLLEDGADPQVLDGAYNALVSLIAAPDLA